MLSLGNKERGLRDARRRQSAGKEDADVCHEGSRGPWRATGMTAVTATELGERRSTVVALHSAPDAQQH